ncbi:MAG: tRNA lysidine(34) synthetase TilS [Candidatus Velamenicoccus archaeovorus]
MYACVKKTVETYRMFAPQDKVLAAVSGGPDSVALLSVLKRLQAALGLEISVASFDHGIRKNSGRDVAFVRQLSESLGYPFFTERLKHKGKSRLSEDFLRRARYDFLTRIAADTGANAMALGHTRDDQAETVLMRLVRGSGLWGLMAVLPVRRQGALKIVRPLIGVSRKDVLRYLKKEGLDYRVDETNEEEVYLRNKIRLRLLPFLEKEFNANVRGVLVNTALSVGADYDYLEQHAWDFLKGHGRSVAGQLMIAEEPLKSLDIALRRMVVRMAISSLTGIPGLLGFRHSLELEELLFGRPAGSEVHLPGGVVVSKEACTLSFACRKSRRHRLSRRKVCAKR